MSDHCADVRASLSAHTDGEDAPLSIQAVDDHVHACAACTAFAAELSLLDERVEAFRRMPVEDRTAAILTSAAEREATAGPSLDQLRGLLGLAAVVQLVLALSALVGVGADHVARDLAVFELAAAGGLGAAAWRPYLAAGLLPVVAVAAVAGIVTMFADTITGASTLGAELAHLVLVVATWPLAVLARAQRGGGTVQPR